MPANLRTFKQVRFFMNEDFKEIVFSTKYYCELCGKERTFNVYGDKFIGIDRDDDQYKDMALDKMRFFHWVDYHRVCAICGNLVKAGDLASVINKEIKIHKNYTLEYKKVKENDEFGHLLIVHKNCITK